MSRQIKFRVWEHHNNKFTNNPVGFGLNNNFELSIPNDSFDGEIRKYTYQQFTGFTDRSGNDIYEGDIFVSYTRKWEPVEFEDGRWQANLQGARVFSVFELFDGVPKGDHPVVIGNMFENDELL
jgi:hypothetical protein